MGSDVTALFVESGFTFHINRIHFQGLKFNRKNGERFINEIFNASNINYTLTRRYNALCCFHTH